MNKKRYILFSYDEIYSTGAGFDMIDVFEDAEELLRKSKHLDMEDYNVFDTKTGLYGEGSNSMEAFEDLLRKEKEEGR